MNKKKVFLTGGDSVNWALDDDIRNAKEALDFVQFTELKECDIVHSVWWEALFNIPISELNGKRIICQITNDPYQNMLLPNFRKMLKLVHCWIAPTKQAYNRLAEFRISSTIVPAGYDYTNFYYLPRNNKKVRNTLNKWNIPTNKYLIGSFQRDTEGRDLVSPKLSKGPDILAEILNKVYKTKKNIHVVLAGPRRYWIKKKLSQYGIPFTFIGKAIDEDDIYLNTLPHSKINILYNLIDLYIVSSRSEGGPKSLLETSATKCEIISSNVGLAEDVLDKRCIYNHPLEAVGLILKDINSGYLNDTIEYNFKQIEKHSILNRRTKYKEVYDHLNHYEPFKHVAFNLKKTKRSSNSQISMFLKKISKKMNFNKRRKYKISIFHTFHKPPWGGGNQFMIALRKYLRKFGYKINENKIDNNTKAILINSIWFDFKKTNDMKNKYKRIKVIHRIDGPIQSVRGKDANLDKKCFEINSKIADITIFQSFWCYKKSKKLGFKAVDPYIILNSADQEIFYPSKKNSCLKDRKVKLVSSSWSDNKRKGFRCYKWLDENLDWDKFEYTFVGQSPIKFKNIKYIPPQNSKNLAEILRKQDIFITASQNDPCSNAVLEALSCGLPVVYLDQGGHPEIVQNGGLGFKTHEEIPALLDKIVDNYDFFRNLIQVTLIKETVTKYLEIIEE
jgi:glycosyltransferase involved in cell wall biosynthesis